MSIILRLWIFLLILFFSLQSSASTTNDTCPTPMTIATPTTKSACDSHYSAAANRDYICWDYKNSKCYAADNTWAPFTCIASKGILTTSSHTVSCTQDCNTITPSIKADIWNSTQNQCACPSGTSKFSHPFLESGIVNECLLSCPGGSVSSGSSSCACPSGMVADLAAGQCVSQCPEGQTWNSTTSSCQASCSSMEELNSYSNQCQLKCSIRADSPAFTLYYSSESIPTCKDGCVINRVDSLVAVTPGTHLSQFVYLTDTCYPDSQNGTPCTSDCSTNEDMTCPEGQMYATWNGVSGCYPIVDYNPPAPPAPTETEETTTSNTTTTENPDGSTTTTTTTTSNTTTTGGSSGGGTTTTTTTTTTNPDGSVTTTTTEETIEETLNTGGLPDGSGGAKSFWESGYPDGVAGVWQSHQAELNNAPIAQWLNSWSFSNSGTCPTFNFSFNLGAAGNFGEQGISGDLFCYLFPVIRALMILSALLFARRMIFGG